MGHDEPDDAARRVAGLGGDARCRTTRGRRCGRSSARRWATTTSATGRLKTRPSTTASGCTRCWATPMRAASWPSSSSTPEVYYYAHYYLNLLSPAGVVPDYRRRRLDTELAALLRLLRDGRGAAERSDDGLGGAGDCRTRFIDFSTPNNVGLACFLLDAARWGRADLQPVAADAVERRGHGRRAGQEGRVPQRLEAGVDLPAPHLSRRGRRRT